MARIINLLIGYLRVSTKKQGASGLGLEAQRAAVESYASQLGAKVGEWYTEVETGKSADRPQLAKALAHTKRSRATLAVAKLDRLARNVAFTSALMRSGADFVACDNPHANTLTIHILAAVAEDESTRIKARTKDALAAAKLRGTKLGSARPGHWKGHEDRRRIGGEIGRAASIKAKKLAAKEAYADLLPAMVKDRADGLTLQAIAERLNGAGHTTRHGAKWNPMQVKRVLERT